MEWGAAGCQPSPLQPARSARVRPQKPQPCTGVGSKLFWGSSTVAQGQVLRTGGQHPLLQ